MGLPRRLFEVAGWGRVEPSARTPIHPPGRGAMLPARGRGTMPALEPEPDPVWLRSTSGRDERQRGSP